MKGKNHGLYFAKRSVRCTTCLTGYSNIFFVVSNIYNNYKLLRFVLLLYGCSRLYTLWLLCHFLPVCLCWSRHVRNTLVMFSAFSILLSLVVFVTSIMLINSLRKEYEKKMMPWIYTFAAFTIFRFLAFLFFSIVNDMIFAYNIIMCLLWTIFIIFSIYGWVLVYSLYIELSDLTKLEDLAHLRMGTMQSLNASTVPSLAGSRPTTPHSTVSTMPA
ncbi:hypothetical protein JTB14_014288 [Gonioctena quinquepunctata]|nr:hypothetical protein JTB14_014288 [Gonioctena quinquepunctata]